MRTAHLALVVVMMLSAACHPGPKIGGGPKMDVPGTIAGIVSTEAKAAVSGRKVTVTNTATGTKYEATTGPNGGYTIQVPEGTYRIDVELQPGEKITKQPGETKINKSDLDPRRDFVISTGKPGGL
jgi:Carboxypeptidase regulatory-like domain